MTNITDLSAQRQKRPVFTQNAVTLMCGPDIQMTFRGQGCHPALSKDLVGKVLKSALPASKTPGEREFLSAYLNLSDAALACVDALAAENQIGFGEALALQLEPSG